MLNLASNKTSHELSASTTLIEASYNNTTRKSAQVINGIHVKVATSSTSDTTHLSDPQDNVLWTTVMHGGGNVMLWGCTAASGMEQHSVIKENM